MVIDFDLKYSYYYQTLNNICLFFLLKQENILEDEKPTFTRTPILQTSYEKASCREISKQNG